MKLIKIPKDLEPQEIKDKIYSGFLPSMFFEYNTIASLTSYLAKKHYETNEQVMVTKKELEDEVAQQQDHVLNILEELEKGVLSIDEAMSSIY